MGNILVLLQLADSAFPSGGFVHSGGLEAAWQHGEIRNRNDVASFVETGLRQVARASLPFLNPAHQEPHNFPSVDRECEAFTSNHVANRASRLQGRALLASAIRIFSMRAFAPPFGHLAPVVGVVGNYLGLDCKETARLFLFQQVRGYCSAAVRLGIVGPFEAQTLQHRMTPTLETMLEECLSLGMGDCCQTSPLLELWQGTQDRLYSRLFQS
ncbi:MAG: urease accessory protein UreF [Pedosphaera sp.]|nr:urease accessory protein UreF [Pedosphaera sp.]